MCLSALFSPFPARQSRQFGNFSNRLESAHLLFLSTSRQGLMRLLTSLVTTKQVAIRPVEVFVFVRTYRSRQR